MLTQILSVCHKNLFTLYWIRVKIWEFVIRTIHNYNADNFLRLTDQNWKTRNERWTIQLCAWCLREPSLFPLPSKSSSKFSVLSLLHTVCFANCWYQSSYIYTSIISRKSAVRLNLKWCIGTDSKVYDNRTRANKTN